jgi:hypothetical protein
MEGQAMSREQALDDLSAVVSKEPGTVVTRSVGGGEVSAEALGGARLRLRFDGIGRDDAATIALDLLGSSAVKEEAPGILIAES